MANTSEGITCGTFIFYNNFDSANLAKVEQVKIPEISDKDACEVEGKSCKSSNSEDSIDYEFNLWTKHDCHETEYQNNNRTWFHFGLKAIAPGVCVKLNIVNLNKQVKMFSQGMSPVFKTVPGHLHWERIREKPTYTLDQKGNDFTLSFHFITPENPKAITYFAFTYPFSFTDLQNYLKKIDLKMAAKQPTVADDIYYHRECAIKSLEDRRLDVLTISSYHNISTEREERLMHLFPDKNEERPFKFWDKKVILISARVHPGETPSSFVLNGFLNFLLNREDHIAINLRHLYVFKLIPMLNPDGVAKGHYRMDTKGVNLNRVYLNPSITEHPTIYAARSLIRYYHYSYNIAAEATSQDVLKINLDDGTDKSISTVTAHPSLSTVICDTTTKLLQQVTLMTLNEKGKGEPTVEQSSIVIHENLQNMSHNKSATVFDGSNTKSCVTQGAGEGISNEVTKSEVISDVSEESKVSNKSICTAIGTGEIPKCSENSGLFLYVDLHGHASKKGVFMYGNHFEDPEDTITCMLLPKLMSINNPNFHFTSCNFAERNMYLIDKRDGMSREGSGRVAVYKMTGLVRSYTLECNYNSGRLVNIVPARIRDGINKTMNHMFIPPKYTPGVFEAVGAALGPSILDLTSNNPNSRLPNSQYRCLRGVKSYLKLTYVNNTISTSFNKPQKDDEGFISQTLPLKRLKSYRTCDRPSVTKESMKSETSLMKKSCILHRATSLFTGMKRIKGNKKFRRTNNSITIKNQCMDDIENNSVMCTIKQENRMNKFATTTGYHRNKKSVSTYKNDVLYMGNKCHKSNTKIDISKNSSKRSNSVEETAVSKNGAKRLKIMTKKPPKTREIGEPSSSKAVDNIVTKSATKTLSSYRTQINKGNLSSDRKRLNLLEQVKCKRFLKLKERTKNN